MRTILNVTVRVTLDAFSPTYVIVVYYVNYVYKMFDYIFCSEVACESMCLCANIRTSVRVSMHVRVYVSAFSFFFFLVTQAHACMLKYLTDSQKCSFFLKLPISPCLVLFSRNVLFVSFSDSLLS